MNLYKILTTVVIFCLTSGTTFGQQTQLKGNIKGLGDAELTFRYSEGNIVQSAIVKVVDDEFSWTAPMPNPQKINIIFPKKNRVQIFVESGNMEISGSVDSLSKLKITGSKTQIESENYDHSVEHITSQFSPLYKKMGKADNKERMEIEGKLADLQKSLMRITTKYVAEHPESAFSLSLVAEESQTGEYQNAETLYSKLGKKAKATSEGKRIYQNLTVLKRGRIGEKMLNFTQNDMDGKPVVFSSFKGKYVLVDLWASWCAPCRAENPNLLKSYNEFKNKNFTIVGISIDDKFEKWQKAVIEDKMPWQQVSDLKAGKNEVSAYYGIRGIPSNFLVDPNGIIIDRDLRGDKLDKRLAELFDK